MRRIEERNENIRALARSKKGGPRITRNLAFMNDRSIKLERAPVMDVGGSLGHLIRDEQGNIMSNIMGREITYHVM
jgi:hypothetical protein